MGSAHITEKKGGGKVKLRKKCKNKGQEEKADHHAGGALINLHSWGE